LDGNRFPPRDVLIRSPGDAKGRFHEGRTALVAAPHHGMDTSHRPQFGPRASRPIERARRGLQIQPDARRQSLKFAMEIWNRSGILTPWLTSCAAPTGLFRIG